MSGGSLGPLDHVLNIAIRKHLRILGYSYPSVEWDGALAAARAYADRPGLVALRFEDAQRLFDALANSMDFGSGFLESDDVEALRALAVAIGVDPQKGTPDEFAAQYPHAFDGETDRMRVAQMYDALIQTVKYGATAQPFTVNHIQEGRMPDHVPCKVGTYGRRCQKPETDPIHATNGAAA
jgi:hypothetical protein